MRVFVTGGTGLVGTRLVQSLTGRGDQPVVLSRNADTAKKKLAPGVEVVQGDPMQPGPWMDAAAGCDGVIHLAGEGVFNKRWNADFKKLLVDSRVLGTRHVAQAISRSPLRADGQPKVLVSASAIGWYGPHGDEELDETAPPADDFFGRLCVEWEREAQAAAAAGVRVANVRVGIVLDPAGGALAKMLTPFRLFVGGPVGSGKQVMSWIHHEDMVGLFLFALDTAGAVGPLNGTAPNPVTNREFGNALGRALGRPSFMWTPGFMLRLGLGEVANVITQGQRVVPRKPLALGYRFRYPTIDGALKQIFSA